MKSYGCVGLVVQFERITLIYNPVYQNYLESFWGKKFNFGTIPHILSQNLEEMGDGWVGTYFENLFPSYSAVHPL